MHIFRAAGSKNFIHRGHALCVFPTSCLFSFR
jgi:hypothetical protein